MGTTFENKQNDLPSICDLLRSFRCDTFLINFVCLVERGLTRKIITYFFSYILFYF